MIGASILPWNDWKYVAGDNIYHSNHVQDEMEFFKLKGN